MRARSIATTLLFLSAANLANATTLHFAAVLRGSHEAPPISTTGKGRVTATLDPTSRMFSFRATYSDMSGPPTAAHFHGPAAEGFNAPPIIGVKSLASPIRGTAMLTDGQIGDLEGGMWYFNVQSAAHPPGEIRGQLKATS